MKIKAIAHEDISKGRLVCLTVVGREDDNEVRIRLAKESEQPDFYSKTDISEGEEVNVSITGDNIWQAEAAEDIRAGVSIGCSGNGLVTESLSKDSPLNIGYSIHSAKEGEIVTYVRKAPSGSNSKGPKGDKGDTGPKGDKGDTGPQGPAGADGKDGVSVTGATSDGTNIIFELSDGSTIEVPWPEQ